MDIYRLIKRAKKLGRATCIVADPCRPPFNAMAERMLEENESAQLLRDACRDRFERLATS